jgi:hypothetical protein
MRARRQPGARCQRSGARPGQAAEAEGGVEGREDGAAIAPFERDALCVGGDVDRAEPCAEAEQREGQAGQTRGEGGEEQRPAGRDQRHDGHTPAAGALAEPARQRHGRQRAQRGREQRQPEPCVGEARLGLHGRDAGCPGAEEQTVAEEEEGDGGASSPHQAITTSTPAAR